MALSNAERQKALGVRSAMYWQGKQASQGTL
jgi:hypothetical protein